MFRALYACSVSAYRHRLGYLVLVCGLLCGGGGAASAATYAIQGDTIGQTTHYFVKDGDNLYDIARRFDLGVGALRAANPGVDPWVLSYGLCLVLPTMHLLPATIRFGIVINLAEQRLYYFATPDTVMTFPLGIGQEGWQTPVGQTKVIQKRKNPTWIPPLSMRRENPDMPAFFPPGPDNPLGAYALYLGWDGYRIHGTNRPYGIGWRSSHGCMRLYPEDIKALFPEIPVGLPVTVVDDVYKLGWRDKALWLEVSPTQQQLDAIVDDREPAPVPIPGIRAAIEKAVGDKGEVDWPVVDAVIAHPTGIPAVIARRKD